MPACHIIPFFWGVHVCMCAQCGCTCVGVDILATLFLAPSILPITHRQPTPQKHASLSACLRGADGAQRRSSGETPCLEEGRNEDTWSENRRVCERIFIGGIQKKSLYALCLTVIRTEQSKLSKHGDASLVSS